MHTVFSALRALFVLGCLVMVPLMAVFGTSLPATLIAAISGQDAAATPAPAPKTLPSAPKVVAAPLPKTPLPSESPRSSFSAPAQKGPDVAPVGFQTPVSPTGDTSKPRGPDPSNLAAPVPSPVHPDSVSVPLPPVPSREKFSSLETRLQQLGAKYYRLVTAGDQNELFHFECQLPVASNPAIPQVFEATDADPLQAVARVVHQVEDFRSGRWQ